MEQRQNLANRCHGLPQCALLNQTFGKEGTVGLFKIEPGVTSHTTESEFESEGTVEYPKMARLADGF